MSASVAWVTGGSGGIGRAVVLELARRGFSVGIGFLRSEDAAGRVVEEAARLGARTQLLRGDLVERKEVHRMGEELVSGLGPPDVLVCAAGVTRDALLGASEAVDFDEVLRVNFFGAVNACREASRHMVARRRERSCSSLPSPPSVPGAVNRITPRPRARPRHSRARSRSSWRPGASASTRSHRA